MSYYMMQLFNTITKKRNGMYSNHLGRPCCYSWCQRVLNNLWRTRLSRRRMIWLLPFPSPVSSASCLSFSVLREMGGGGEEPNNTVDGEKPGPLSIIQYSRVGAINHLLAYMGLPFISRQTGETTFSQCQHS
jgi:hypothetical protein